MYAERQQKKEQCVCRLLNFNLELIVKLINLSVSCLCSVSSVLQIFYFSFPCKYYSVSNIIVTSSLHSVRNISLCMFGFALIFVFMLSISFPLGGTHWNSAVWKRFGRAGQWKWVTDRYFHFVSLNNSWCMREQPIE